MASAASRAVSVPLNLSGAIRILTDAREKLLLRRGFDRMARILIILPEQVFSPAGR